MGTTKGSKRTKFNHGIHGRHGNGRDERPRSSGRGDTSKMSPVFGSMRLAGGGLRAGMGSACARPWAGRARALDPTWRCCPWSVVRCRTWFETSPLKCLCLSDQGPRTKDQGPRTKDQGPRTPCYLLPATCYLLPATCYLLPATGYRLPATGYRLPATGYRLPATGYRLPATGGIGTTKGSKRTKFNHGIRGRHGKVGSSALARPGAGTRQRCRRCLARCGLQGGGLRAGMGSACARPWAGRARALDPTCDVVLGPWSVVRGRTWFETSPLKCLCLSDQGPRTKDQGPRTPCNSLDVFVVPEVDRRSSGGQVARSPYFLASSSLARTFSVSSL
ncbi:hypothetical protein Hsar01_03371 [Haloferula sargassicola]|uniref:Uncharacterized protein n=1 Tax=Haloferula sargassicola TaxID=490096 RepID=A0ABP9UTV1_9BACT